MDGWVTIRFRYASTCDCDCDCNAYTLSMCFFSEGGGGMQSLIRRSNQPCGNNFLAVFARWVPSKDQQKGKEEQGMCRGKQIQGVWELRSGSRV